MGLKIVKEGNPIVHMSRRKEISVSFIKVSLDHMLWHKDKFWSILELWFLHAVLLFTLYISHILMSIKLSYPNSIYSQQILLF